MLKLRHVPRLLLAASHVIAVLALVLAVGGAAQAVTIDWLTVGDPGNVADDTGYGAVAYTYPISKYETTNAQYSEFLNAVAATDTNALYNTSMASGIGGITRSGSSGEPYCAARRRGTEGSTRVIEHPGVWASEVAVRVGSPQEVDNPRRRIAQ